MGQKALNIFLQYFHISDNSTRGFLMPAKNKKEILTKFGENLSELRKKRNLSLRKLSTLCDVDYSDIKKYEDGDVNPTLLTIVELAAGLGIHPKELMDFGMDFTQAKEKRT